jgi:hypothetical protein
VKYTLATLFLIISTAVFYFNWKSEKEFDNEHLNDIEATSSEVQSSYPLLANEQPDPISDMTGPSQEKPNISETKNVSDDDEVLFEIVGIPVISEEQLNGGEATKYVIKNEDGTQSTIQIGAVNGTERGYNTPINEHPYYHYNKKDLLTMADGGDYNAQYVLGFMLIKDEETHDLGEMFLNKAAKSGLTASHFFLMNSYSSKKDFTTAYAYALAMQFAGDNIGSRGINDLKNKLDHEEIKRANQIFESLK